MKSKRLLLMLLVALCAPWAAMAQNRQIVEIGTGSSTTYYPMPGFYGFQYDVYLYTPTAAPELGADSDISSIAYNLSTTSSSTGATIEIWVKDVDASFALASSTTFADYISGATKVVDDNAFTTDATGWKTMSFSSTFSHQGGKALLVAVRGVGCSTGGGCSRSNYYTSASYMHWNKRADGTDPGTSATGSIDGNRSNIRLDVTYTGAVCFAPTNLTCTTYTATTATLSWTENGEATQWELEYSTASDFTGANSETVSGTPTKELIGLTAEQTYYARVKADCGSGDQSGWSSTCEFKPSAYTIIGTGTSTTNNAPLMGSYNNSYDQMIYTASQLGLEASEITKIAFNSSTANDNPRTITIYMGHTTKSNFSSNSDFISINDLTEVYSGTWNITAGWNEFELTTPFDYDGSSNLVIALYSKGSWSTTYFYYTATSSNQVVYAYSDSNDPNPNTYEGNWGSFNNRGLKTELPNLKLLAVASSTPKPRNLVVSHITTEGAKVTWEAPANNVTGYQYQYKYATTPTWPDTWNSLAANVTHKDLVALAANTLYDFRVRANYAEGDSDPAEIQFTTEATCLPPTGLHVASLTATSVTIAWDAEEDALYQVYFPGGQPTNPFDPTTPPENSMDDWGWNTQPETGGTASWNNSLTPQSHYGVWVRRYCGPNEFSDPISIEFDTPCGAYDIPYVYGFEDAAPFGCWTVISGNITLINGSQNTGSYRLDFRGTTSNMIALPQFNEPTNNLRVEFWTRPESTGGSSGKFAIGYMTDITDASTFVAVETYNSTEMTTTYVKKTVDFINVPANANIAMRQFDCATNYYWYVDDVTVKEIPSCLAPTDLAANASTTSAELSWTANSGETAWTVYYKKTTDENYTEVANATNPYTLNGLTAATNYQYYVVANCSADDASEASEVFPFVTECEVIAALGYSENFDGYTVASTYTAPSARVLPTCWNAINTTTYSTYSVFPTIYYYSSTNYANSTPNSLKFYSYYSSSYSSYDPQPQYAILPEMSSLAGKEIVLYARGYYTSSTFKIGTMSDPEDASTFNLITEQTGLTTSYQKFSYIIPANCTDSYLAIMIDAATSSRTTNGVYIDDITIKDVVYVDTYQIVNTVSDPATEMTWNEFVTHWNNGDHFTHSTFELKEDIDNTITTMVGTQDRPFTGVFDGQDHWFNTIDIESDETGAALFHYIKDATIKNLHVMGNVTATTAYHIGGLVGYAWSGNNTIENCYVNTNIEFPVYGGGIIGHAKSSRVYLKGCYYGGGITATSSTTDTNSGVGGLVGWCDASATIIIYDCFYEDVNGYTGSVYFHPVACKTANANINTFIYDCYYTCDDPAADTDGQNNVGTNLGRKAYTVTGAEDITVDLNTATTHYTCSGIYGDGDGTDSGIKFGSTSTVYGGEGMTLSLALSGAPGYAADHGTLTPISTTYTLLMEASNTVISGVDCPVPYNVAVSNVEARSARVTWNGGSESYTIMYGEVVDDVTTYDFEDQTIPDNFTNDATYPWVIASSGHGGSYSIKSGNNGNHSTTSSIEMPVVLASGSTLSFYCLASCESASYYWDYGIFYIDGEQQDRFLHVTEWQHKTYELAAGTHTLKWTFTKDSSGQGGDDCFYVDDVTITSSAVETWTTLSNITASPYTIENLTPETTYQVKVSGTCGGTETEYSEPVPFTTIEACSTPSEFAVGEVTAHTAAISWNGGNAENWTMFVKKSTETDYPASGEVVNTPAKTLESLDAATTYDVKIVAGCDENKVLEVAEAFTTECDVITVDLTHPFTEGFEGTTFAPQCWENIASGTRQWSRTTTSSNIHTGSGAAYSGYYGDIYLVMPDIQISSEADGAQLTFWSYNTWVSSYGKNSVVLINGENETELWSPESVSQSWVSTTIDLTAYMGQTIRIAFKYEGNNAHGWYIDDVEFAATKTFTKTIAPVGEEGWESGKGGYYFIASPVTEPVTPTEANGFIPETVANYDLYYFSQACDADGNEWINFKDETLGGYNLTNGKGYLYASKEGTTLTFTGTPGTNGTVTLDAYDADARFKGWNLIGNPFAEDAYINKPFYTLENSGSFTSNRAGTAIQPMQGVLIVAEEDETSVDFSTEAPATNDGKLNMNLSRNNKQLDNAILVFGGDQQLGKMTFRANSSKIFMPVEGKDYAITSVEGQVGEVPVSFVPESNGTYSLSFTSEEVTFSYLHLIDNMTGNDVNLLQTPSYSFDARTSDYESRFRLVFATGSSTGSDTFGFVNASGNFCIFGIEGEATVQVIDVLGHVLSSETFSGSYEKRINGAPGVYMVRLIQGNDVKVQKVVVR